MRRVPGNSGQSLDEPSPSEPELYATTPRFVRYWRGPTLSTWPVQRAGSYLGYARKSQRAEDGERLTHAPVREIVNKAVAEITQFAGHPSNLQTLED